MRTTTTTRLRRGVAVLMAAGGAALLAASPVLAQAEVRTQTELFGYDLEAHASPVSVRFFEDFIPIPTDPGEPQFEITGSYTGAKLGTGPNGRAVASSIWPGAAVGDGFGTLAGDESQTYPVRAAARYPGRGEDSWSQQTAVDGTGAGMFAEARGLDVTARSEGGGVPADAAALVDFGQVRSQSTTTVKDGRAQAHSIATISNVRLLDGLIVLDTVSTELGASSDGNGASTSGHTTVGGIEVLGVPVRLTEQGAVVVPPSDDDGEGDGEGSGNPLQPLQDLLGPVNQAIQQLTDDLVADGLEETLGIRIEALDHREDLEGPVGERTAEGVSITVDLAVLRGYLDPLLDVVPIGDLLGAIPEDESGGAQQVKGLVYELLGLAPKVQYVVGSGFVAASASPAFEMPELAPPPPPPPPPPPVTSGTTTDTTVPSSGVALPPPTSSGTSDVPAASVAPPSTGSPSVAPPAPVADPMEPFGGVPAAAVGLSLLLGAIPTFGMRSVRDAAVGLSASTDVPHPLPDLRGGA